MPYVTEPRATPKARVNSHVYETNAIAEARRRERYPLDVFPAWLLYGSVNAASYYGRRERGEPQALEIPTL